MIRDTIKRIFFSKKTDDRPKPNSSYICAEETINAAKAQNLSVCEYVEQLWDQAGLTGRVISEVFTIIESDKINDVLEIGAGTGRYIEKTLKIISPRTYESYEIAEDWNHYLRNQYPDVKVYQATGSTLPNTADHSIDLVMAHGVFVYLPFLVSLEYFNEVVRVVRPGKYFVFDCYTEKCFENTYLNAWLQSAHRYPVILPLEFVNKFFVLRGFRLENSFTNKHGHGISQYLVYQKI